MPAPDFKKLTFGDNIASVSIYAGAVKVQSVLDPHYRKHYRIVLKPASENPGVLFTFKKLTIQLQEDNFEKLINLPDIQQWFLAACKQKLLEEE